MVLILFSALAIAGNLWITFGGLFKKRKSSQSLVPFVGGIAGVIGLLLLPIERPHHFWWVPTAADLGCGPMLLAVLVDQIKKRLHG